MLDVIDALVELLAADLALDVDDSAERPFEWEAGKVYAWEESSSQRPIGTGEVREDFVVVVAIAEASGEEAAGQRSREVTGRLYGYRDLWLDRIRLSAHVGPWQDGNIEGASIPSYLRQLDLRGIAVRVSGWRIVE